ncbi:MAG: VOC family protein [Ilumatobacteraceae bacterium]
MNVDLHHVSIGVQDVAAAVEFYAHLGITSTGTRPGFGVDGAWLQVGERQIHLIETTVVPPGATNHLALRVADLDACLVELAEHGISGRRSTYTPGAGRQAFLQDPSGNVVELNQLD